MIFSGPKIIPTQGIGVSNKIDRFLIFASERKTLRFRLLIKPIIKDEVLAFKLIKI